MITETLNVDEYLTESLESTLHNLSLSSDFMLPVSLPLNDPTRVRQTAIVQPISTAPQPYAPLTAGSVPAAAYKKFADRDSSSLSADERRDIARWMAAEAESRNFPPELPVMAALTETGGTLRNLLDGDRDSVGFFQIRVGVHGAKAVETPEAQMQWFLYNASRCPLSLSGRRSGWSADFFRQQIAAARASNNSGQLAAWLGRWCQDIERSAFPDRYEQRYDQARKLIYGQ
jgi:hypothetical protein